MQPCYRPRLPTSNFVLCDATTRTPAAGRRNDRCRITQSIVKIGGSVLAATFEFHERDSDDGTQSD